MGNYTNCAQCGRRIEKSGWNKMMSKQTAGFGGRQKGGYCSKNCEDKAKGNSGAGKILGGLGNLSVDVKGIDIMGMVDADDKKKDATLDNITNMELGNSVEEISDACNKMVTIAASQSEKDVKKAIAEKLEFAIMKLRGQGANAEADFFEQKRKKIKPGWF